METAEIQKELSMKYDELCEYLLKKYGPSAYDFFPNKECRVKNKRVTRTSEGLYCHHVKENLGGDLSSPGSAKLQPFEWQLKENLIYCNLIEHLILHIKIAVLRQKTIMSQRSEVFSFFTTGGIFMICSDIVDYFFSNGTNVAWRKRCFEEIEENFEDYLDIIGALISYIKNHYDGDVSEEQFLSLGKKVKIGEICDISDDMCKISIKTNGGEIRHFDLEQYYPLLTFTDAIQMRTRKLFTGYNGFYNDYYQKYLNHKMDNAYHYAQLLEVDFAGYGYPQFTRCYLDYDKYGAHNIDEYLHLGLPSTFGNHKNEIITKPPIFWKGKLPDAVLNNQHLNFIVRADASFHVKQGCEAFLYYKDYKGYLRPGQLSKVDEDNNLAFKNGYIPQNSDWFNRDTNEYYSEIKRKDGTICPTSLIIFISKSDIPYFFKNYDVKNMIYWMDAIGR